MKRLPMCAESIHAILAGAKDLTTRVVVLPKSPYRTVTSFPGDKWTIGAHPSGRGFYAIEGTRPADEGMLRSIAEHPGFDAPFSVGDRVAFTEVWQYRDWTEDGIPFIRYRADDTVLIREGIPDEWLDRVGDIWATLSDPANYRIDNRASDRKWRSARFMPCWASRYIGTITSVASGLLWDMTDEDYRREGVLTLPWFKGDLLAAWMEWWDKLDGHRYPYASNPWVYHYGFEREEK